ncbi:unnamed protein product, partial [marine sediment metagenome]
QKAVWAGKIKMGEIEELEPLFTEARDEIGDISYVGNYEKSPTYQRIVAGCEAIYKEEIKGREGVRKHITDPYLEALDKARVDRAKGEIEKAAPTPTDFPEATVKLETPEDFERLSKNLKQKAKRLRREAMTPEERVFGLPSAGWGLAVVSEWERMYKWSERECHLLEGLREHTRDSLFWDYWDEWEGKVTGYEGVSREIYDWVSDRVEACQLESRYLARLGRECFAATLLETSREAFDPESVNIGNEAGRSCFREIWEEVRVGPAWPQLELETEKLKTEQRANSGL